MAIFISRRTIYLFNLAWIGLLALWLTMGHCIHCDARRVGDSTVRIQYDFLAPMRKNVPVRGLMIEDQYGRAVNYNAKWESRRRLVVTIEEKDTAQGLSYHYCFRRAPAMIWPFSVSGDGVFGTKVEPRVIGVVPDGKVACEGPLSLQFNTPVSGQSFLNAVRLDVPGRWEAAKARSEDGSVVKDQSRWLFYPERPFKYGFRYKLEVTPVLRSTSGVAAAGDGTTIFFETVPEFLIMDRYPEAGARSVWLSRTVSVQVNQKVEKAEIEVEGVSGRVSVDGTCVSFVPDRCFRPNSDYRVKGTITSIYGQTIKVDFEFSTTKLGDQEWIEVKTGRDARAWLMRGSRELKEVPVIFNGDPAEIPRVTMYEGRRGFSPDSKRPWFWLNADILIHSLPHDRGNDNHMEVGLPRSYACIIIPAEDAIWIARHCPRGFMVLVHE